ncbi:hypothetical protein F8388_026166 [Cannabis sativa]|uniref:Uncharacterized protein n=1 Tax=Cannabis sativa TaxID=3483 RepID=A0A7J6GFM7_CANSA|nr:hypothetical protein F8388_026166 [Cannabis sativa]KAF4381771.1 hypothetical protein G4B88_002921 [Cannabis sativa]
MKNWRSREVAQSCKLALLKDYMVNHARILIHRYYIRHVLIYSRERGRVQRCNSLHMHKIHINLRSVVFAIPLRDYEQFSMSIRGYKFSRKEILRWDLQYGWDGCVEDYIRAIEIVAQQTYILAN